LNSIELLKRNIENSITAKGKLLSDQVTLSTFEKATNLVIDRYMKGGRLYIAGNGGSAADAQHLAAEFVSRLARDRAPLPAEALTVDSSILTAIANDYGYEFVFSRQLTAKATLNDIFLGITTSGNSANIINALQECRRLGIPTIVFCGRDGGEAKALADYCVTAPGTATSTIQEMHILLAHTLCELVETAMFRA
jgi:D-sedoheptulose 7-phosphate isomerase